MNISEQFYGRIKTAKWIEDGFSLIKNLVNKIEIPDGVKTTEFDYWMIGPIHEEKGKIFLFGLDKGAHTEHIRSINPIQGTPELLIVTEFDTVRKVNVNRSATRIAQTLDCLLHGAYTDIPPLHIDSILGEIYSDHF